jgi:hypothetical protein
VKIEGGAAYPFWSPDGQSLAFFSGGKLRRVSSNGGNSQDVADAESGRGGAWSADGVILFTPAPQAGLFRVPAAGGEATLAIKVVGQPSIPTVFFRTVSTSSFMRRTRPSGPGPEQELERFTWALSIPRTRRGSPQPTRRACTRKVGCSGSTQGPWLPQR